MRTAFGFVVSLSATVAADTVIGRGHVPDTTRELEPAIGGGVGFEGFVGTSARERFAVGPAWNVRIGILERSEIRFELAYHGSSQAVKDIDGARLVAHGVHALVRVNVMPSWTTEPYFYLGGGWARFDVDTEMPGDLLSPDHVLEIPFGFGVARRFGRIVLDARAGITVVSGADLVPRDPTSSSTEGHTLHRFGVRANVGVEL